MTPSQEILALRAKTAMERYSLSRPVRLALRDGIITNEDDVFDYGCGKGSDIELLKQIGIEANGWDPYYRSDASKVPASVVNLGFVVNVIENPKERVQVVREAFGLARKCLVLAAQMEATNISKGQEFSDGILTTRNTFQKYFSHSEIKALVMEATGKVPYSVERGIYFIFRSEESRIEYFARRQANAYRVGVADALTVSRQKQDKAVAAKKVSKVEALQSHHLMPAVVNFLVQRGRLPMAIESSELRMLLEAGFALNDISKAVALIADQEEVRRSVEKRKRDVRVILALMKFDQNGRPKFGEFPIEVVEDIKSFFGSYSEACASADALLFGLADKAVMKEALDKVEYCKKLPDAIYFHSTVLPHLSDIIQVFVGCARALVGDIEDEHIVKISKSCESVSFLYYKDFESDPHPELLLSTKVDLYKRKVSVRDYSKSDNPPILHRKELFVMPTHPKFQEFQETTLAQEKAGLLSRADIGFKKQWLNVIAETGGLGL